MKVIRPNCRVQFTSDDIDFILCVLQPGARSRECLIQLLADEESRDMILDQEALYQAVLERRNCPRISLQFYFYILVRQLFRRHGITSREVADYVAEMLAEFSQVENLECRVAGRPEPLEYLVDMLGALQSADESTAFALRAHIGNRSLFLAGIFPEHLRHRVQRRAAPGLEYYEALGRESFRQASNHRLARQYNVVEVFSTLADQFEITRKALNDLGDRLITIGDVGMPVRALLNVACNPQVN